MILLADDFLFWVVIWPLLGFIAGTLVGVFHMSKAEGSMQREQREKMAFKDREIEYWKGKAIHG
jgi:hypothetical protein